MKVGLVSGMKERMFRPKIKHISSYNSTNDDGYVYVKSYYVGIWDSSVLLETDISRISVTWLHWLHCAVIYVKPSLVTLQFMRTLHLTVDIFKQERGFHNFSLIVAFLWSLRWTRVTNCWLAYYTLERDTVGGSCWEPVTNMWGREPPSSHISPGRTKEFNFTPNFWQNYSWLTLLKPSQRLPLAPWVGRLGFWSE